MADDLRDSIAELSSEFRHARETAVTVREIERIEATLRELRDNFTALRVTLEHQRSDPPDLSPIERSLDHVRTAVEVVEKKTPPLSTIAGAFGVVLLVLGYSYLDLRSMSEPIKQAGSELVSAAQTDRKSTRMNSSHLGISYAVFCLKKKKQKEI